MKSAPLLLVLFIGVAFSPAGPGADSPGAKRVLFFSKAASWEQKIIHRDRDELSSIEKAVEKLGRENQIEFTFSKDGGIFTAANLAQYDAFFFYTSGDLTFQERTGRGDNYPLMSLEGKRAFLDAIREGKGFVGCNTAVYTFVDAVSPGEEKSVANSGRYTRMIGGGYIGHNEVQEGRFTYLDRQFPGMEKVPADYHPIDQWYAFKNLMPDLHVIMTVNAAKLTGNLYERPDYPIAWARREGKGRVFYTTMGHTAEIWKDPVFLQMLVGGLHWATGAVEADVTPDVATVTPMANEIPAAAGKFVPSHPPAVNPHFPNFKVWLEQEYLTKAKKRVLVFSKSAGCEPPVAYRDTAWPSPLESELLKLGQEEQIDFVFTKDGTFFTPENLASFDTILCCTSGDPAEQPRNGLGDNYPLMTRTGKRALLEAVQGGKGLIAVHSAIDLPGAGADAESYRRLLGATPGGEAVQPKEGQLAFDRAFPGMEALSAGFPDLDDWHAFQHFQPDLHAILSWNTSKPAGEVSPHAKYPIAWVRMEGKGRVYYTSVGRDEATWKSADFRRMLLGAIQWTTGMVDADITPNVDGTKTPSN